MKTALTALAIIATATTASADFAVIDNDSVGNGQFEIVTQTGGEFTLSRVNCVPMQSAVLDTADSASDLDDDYNGQELVEVVRGTVAHDIAVAACS